MRGAKRKYFLQCKVIRLLFSEQIATFRCTAIVSICDAALYCDTDEAVHLPRYNCEVLFILMFCFPDFGLHTFVKFAESLKWAGKVAK